MLRLLYKHHLGPMKGSVLLRFVALHEKYLCTVSHGHEIAFNQGGSHIPEVARIMANTGLRDSQHVGRDWHLDESARKAKEHNTIVPAPLGIEPNMN